MPSRRPTRHAKNLCTRYVLTLLSRCPHARPPQQALIHADAVSPYSHELAFSLLVARPGMEATARLPIRQMVLQILRARAHREDVQLFDQPKPKQGRGYPFWQFIGPLPRPEHREKLQIRQPTAQEWRWDSDFRDDLIRWVNELVLIPGKG